MLSIEKLPPDPSNQIFDDETPCSSSDKNILDLHVNKFSIRDYVFETRRKDIQTNWPFSQKNLQLCMKHGVTDVLPPFHQSVKRCAMENTREEHVKVDAGSRNIDISSGSTSRSCSEIDSNKSGKGRLAPMLKPSAKKCRLVVKLGDRTVEEDTTTTTTNSFVVSEVAMASKVCPVCKTFSSSSNTTLNAHIDQCLSGESSTIKWTANSKVINNKYRIKPRKTRLMVDIYSTALSCTLEDLDRRNGTNWAGSKASMSVRETDVSVEKPHEGAVYIDANGTKVRILSKFSDEQLPSSSKLVNDSLDKNLVERDKRSISFLTKKRKKKNHIPKQHKLLKSAPPCTKNFSLSKPYDCPKIKSGHESTFSSKENVDKEDCVHKNLRYSDHLVSNGLGTIKQWACSKRTGLTRKVRSPRSSAKPVCLPESNLRTGNMLREPQDEHSDEEPSLQKKEDLSSSRSQLLSIKKRSLVLQSFKTKHLKVDDHSVKNDSFDRARSVKNIRVRTNADNSEINCELSTSAFDGSAARSVNCNLKWKTASLKRSSMQCSSESEEAGVCETEEEEEETHCLRGNLGETKVHRSRVVNVKEKSSHYSAEIDSDSDLETRNDKNMDLSASEFAVGGDFASFSKSLDAGSDEFEGSFLSTKAGMCSQDPISDVHDQEGMFNAAEIRKSVIIDDHNVHDDEQGNYFLEVDPIPIPGPPGSFLPSPGRTSSEEDDLHGSSSLTSSRNQSSGNHPRFVDQDSSGSPTSAASTVSKVNLHVSFPGKGAFGFPNDKPCCCVRKEEAALNREESQLLQRRAMAPSILPATDSVRRPSNIILRTNSFCVSDSSTSGFETNGTKLSTGHTDHIKLAVARDSESFCPSASSNPVLRLMGKDLMVVNKDDVANTRLPGVSCGNFPQVSPTEHGDSVQRFDVGLLNGFKSHESYTKPMSQLSSPTSPVLMGSSFGRQDYVGGGCNLHAAQNGPNYETTRDMQKFISTPMISNWPNHATSVVKEIIVIDDSQETGSHTSRFMNFSENRPRGVVQKANFPTHQVNEIPAKWNGNPEGCSTFVHPSSFSASSSSAGPFRSSLYYSPGFS